VGETINSFLGFDDAIPILWLKKPISGGDKNEV
jgi:hypothetical protein